MLRMKYFLNVFPYGLVVVALLFLPIDVNSFSGDQWPAEGVLSPWPKTEEGAYELEFEGHAAYREGNFQQAIQYYSQAHASLPNDPDIKLALGLALSRKGEGLAGRQLIGQVQQMRNEEHYLRYRALRHFYSGMSFAYEGQYAHAIANYRKAMAYIDVQAESMLASMVHNAAGFAIMLNQGGGEHGRGLPSHYHVHRRDMESALGHFQEALRLDPKNTEARYNYDLIRKALDLPADDPVWSVPSAEPPLAGLMDQIEKAFDFLAYEEVVFLLDISGSMIEAPIRCNGYNRYSLMKGVMGMMLQGVDEGKSLGLGTVGGPCEEPPAHWHPTGSLGIKQMAQEIRTISPKGTTPLFATVQASLDLFSDDPSTSKGIFLVTDGDDMCGTGSEAICAWAGAVGENVSVNVLTFLGFDASGKSKKAFSEYLCLARQTGGEVLYVDDSQCRVEQYAYAMHNSTGFLLPDLFRVDCWGPAVPDLWGMLKEPLF